MIGAGSYMGASVVMLSGSELADDCFVGDLAAIREGCQLGEKVLIGRAVMVESRVRIGPSTRVQTGAYITDETEIEDAAFIGPGVLTTNDRYMSMWTEKTYRGPRIGRMAAIGAGAQLLAGITVGDKAVIGMGAVVIADVPPGRIFVGVPARDVGEVRRPQSGIGTS